MNDGQLNEEEKAVQFQEMSEQSGSKDESEAAVGAVALDERSPTDIAKLNIDCFEELFDYLSLNDLSNLGKSSKWMQRVAGYCFRLNYSAAEAKWEDELIHIRSGDNWSFGTIFAPHINKLNFEFDLDLQSFLTVKPNCPRIKHIEFVNLDLSQAQMGRMKEIFDRVEVLKISACEIEGDFHANILALCPNLRRLSVGSYTGEIGDDSNWLLQTYPKLDFFELQPLDYRAISELKTFLELNPTIRKLRISAQCLWKNRHSLLKAKVTLDDLEIVEIDIESDNFLHLLNELREQNFYQRLSVSWWYFDQEAANRLTILKALVTLYAFNSEHIHLDLPVLANIEELYFYKCNETNLVDLAKDLTKLKRIVLTIATFDDIRMLMGRNRSLQKLKVEKIENGTHFSNNILNLAALNAEREKLGVAQKVQIYVNEEIYLATKWSIKLEEFRLVGIKRTQSFEWDHAFRWIQ